MTDPRKPSLSYHVNEAGGGIIGDGVTLANAFEVSAWQLTRGDEDHAAGDLVVYVRGQMRKKDGERSRVQRSVLVDTSTDQPDWLRLIIGDARRRLALEFTS